MTSTVDSRRRWALAAIVLAAIAVGFDITILNVALPTIATELWVGTAGLQWVVNAYVLVLAGLMLIYGAWGDRYGRKPLLGICADHARSRDSGTTVEYFSAVRNADRSWEVR